MKQKIMHIFTRTPLHVGAGNSVGVVDSPIMRERHTRIPIIPGSSLKGVLRDLPGSEEDKDWLFGKGSDEEAAAGALLIGEARVLAFPVRSAKNSFAWITCPLALSRFKRDAGCDFAIPDISSENKCLASAELGLKNNVVLEEYCFEISGEIPGDILGELKDIHSDEVWSSLGERLAIVSDEIFSYFVANACEVVTRIRVNDATGTVDNGALFNQEQAPSETMFYASIGAQAMQGKSENEALNKLSDALKNSGRLIQVGANETIGLGYCSVNMEAGQ
jgi:CRISPR-associated protein Cmr4